MNPGEIIVNSAQPSNGSSNTADGLHPAKSQQPGATRSDFFGTWEAGSAQLQGIGPLYGRRFGPTSGPGGSSMELRGAARLPFHGHQPGQLGRMETASETDRVETRNPLAIASRPQRFSRWNRQQRNREAIATVWVLADENERANEQKERQALRTRTCPGACCGPSSNIPLRPRGNCRS
jgi:hypothetical protein